MNYPSPNCSEAELIASRQLGKLLLSVESQIALLARCRPLNAASERSRVLESLENKTPIVPQWTYAPAPCLTETLELLARLQRNFPDHVPFADLWVARVRELHLEAELAESIGTTRFFSLACQRYTPTLGTEEQAAAQLALQWLQLVAEEELEPTIRTDDRRNPQSLLRILEAQIAEQHLDFRLTVSNNLQSLAATGQNIIVIAANRWIPASVARRISQHEVHGHAIPRSRAALQTHGLMLIGAPGCNEQEEGRALLIEENSGLLKVHRQRELGLRHELAVSGRAGQSWMQAVMRARQVVSSWTHAFDLASRAHRGGGLFREACYLPAFERLRRVLPDSPNLDSWLSAGRMTIEASFRLQAAGLRIVQDKSGSTTVDLSATAARVTPPRAERTWDT